MACEILRTIFTAPSISGYAFLKYLNQKHPEILLFYYLLLTQHK